MRLYLVLAIAPLLSYVGGDRCTTKYKEGRLLKTCKPYCPDACPIGVCNFSKEQCVCKDGSHLEYGMCVKDCPAGCQDNAYCVAGTNECRCKPDYEESQRGVCTPVCSNGCGVNMFCKEPEKCVCLAGYKKTASETCEPICALRPCGAHARCVAHEKCECDLGYGPKAGSTNDCESLCDLASCENGECTASGKCKCWQGYKRQHGSATCQPYCEHGCRQNEICISPDHCDCVTGYLKHIDDGLCKPVCTKGCGISAYCFAPERCACSPGYRNDSGLCVAHCSKGCPRFSYCLAPEACRCYEGYIMLNAGCECRKGYSKDIGGACIAPASVQGAPASVTGSIYIAFGLMALALAIFGYVGYKYTKRICPKTPVNAEQRPADNYIITYQPTSDPEDGQVVCSEDRRVPVTPPPSYRMITKR